MVADPFDPLIPLGQRIEAAEKTELSIPGVASTGAAGYDFFGNQSRAGWRARILHGDGARAERSLDTIGRPMGGPDEIELQMANLFGARIGLFASVMLISTTALAQQKSEEIASPPSKEIEKHLHNYGNFDNTCIRWTDKCRNCSRSISGYDPICSNIGIACEPAEVECLERQQDGEKK